MKNGWFWVQILFIVLNAPFALSGHWMNVCVVAFNAFVAGYILASERTYGYR